MLDGLENLIIFRSPTLPARPYSSCYFDKNQPVSRRTHLDRSLRDSIWDWCWLVMYEVSYGEISGYKHKSAGSPHKVCPSYPAPGWVLVLRYKMISNNSKFIRRWNLSDWCRVQTGISRRSWETSRKKFNWFTSVLFYLERKLIF